MSIQIRKAEDKDLDDLVCVLNDSLDYKISLDDNSWGVDQFNKHEILTIMDRGETYVALVDDKVVATMSLEWSDKRIWGKYLGNDNKAVYLHKLAVNSQYRGNNLGKILISKTEDLARSHGKVYIRLDCAKNNLGLIKYYKNLGFTLANETHIKDDDYLAVLMQKTVILTDEI